MDDFKTVEGELQNNDPLLRKQKEGVAAMRTSLLACSDNPTRAVKDLTNLRVYHQLTRIVRYTELMDKLEEKLYQSIEDSVMQQDTANPTTWIALLNIQERLQENMIKSHKLLEPYLGVEPDVTLATEVSATEVEQQSILDRASRDNVRKAAQQLLLMLDEGGQDD